MNDISRDVYRIISETCAVPTDQLGPELLIRSIPNVESVKVLTVILKVEKHFDIEIPDEATFALATVGEFDELVGGLCAERLAAVPR